MPDRNYSLNPQAVDELFREQKLDDALKVVAAATQYQGMRGYQQALKDGMSPEKAMTKYAPMIYYGKQQGVGSAIRALTPPPVKPNFTYRPATNGAPAYFGADQQRPVFIPQTSMPLDMTLQKPAVTELPGAPGVKVIQVPGSRAWQALHGPKEPVITETIRQEQTRGVNALNNPTTSLTNRTVRGVAPQRAAPSAAATSSTRVDRANALAKEHPEWTKAQIIEAVRKELK